MAYATLAETKLCKNALEGEVQVHVADSEDQLRETLSRGDISVAVVFGEHERDVRASAHLVTGGLTTLTQLASPVADPVPRLVYCTSAQPSTLVEIYSEGKLYQSLSRPVDAQTLALTVQRASEDYAVRIELNRVSLELERALRRERARQPPPHPLTESSLSNLLVESAAMREVLKMAQMVAPHDAHVLLQGETGTGKELVARTIHELSNRANGPFVVQDCGALTETLLESELFGHTKGAFTGAESSQPGLFHIAEGGTVFLDEIENMTPLLQTKLLRVVETGEVRSLGASRTRKVDVRVVAASNRDLQDQVDSGRLRADLFYRLNTFPIEIPPLRRRQEDILPLANEFRKQASVQFERRVGALTARTQALLIAYRWPGNVRELKNVIERAVLLTPAEEPIGPQCLPPVFSTGSVPKPISRRAPAAAASLKTRIAAVEREIIYEALERHGGKLARVAEELHTNAVTLGRKARRYGLWPMR